MIVEKVQVDAFPCKYCGRDVPVNKLSRGPHFVFCRASCSRAFTKATPDGGERQVKLSDYHRAAKSFIEAHRDREGHPVVYRRRELEKQIFLKS